MSQVSLRFWFTDTRRTYLPTRSISARFGARVNCPICSLMKTCSPNYSSYLRGFDSRPPGAIMSPFVLAGPSWKVFQLQWWEPFRSFIDLKLKLGFLQHFSVYFKCLDEVNITVETCELNDRASGGSSASGPPPGISAPQGKYSFIHKVIDGITIIVNTVNVKFKSPAFTASVQVSIYLNSMVL